MNAMEFEQPIEPDPADMPTVDDLVRAVIAAEERADREATTRSGYDNPS